jgi:hypothetical protein
MNAQPLVISSLSTRISAFFAASLMSVFVLTSIDAIAAHDYAAAVAAHTESTTAWQVEETKTVVGTAKRLSKT